MPIVLPVCLSMLISDAVAFDSLEGKPSILGVTHFIRCRVFPVLSPRLAVFAELTSGRGEVELDFTTVITRADGGMSTPATSDQMRVTFADPLDVRIAGTHVDQLLLRAPGEIVVRMSAGGTVIMERHVRVVRASQVRQEP